MGIKELLHQYHGLEPTEQAAFAAMIRAHQVFNSAAWQAELARRAQQVESATSVPIVRIEQLLRELEGH